MTRNSRAVWRELGRQLARYGLEGRIRVRHAYCLHRCQHGPNMELYPDGTWYAGLRPQDAEAIVREHIAGGKVVSRLTRDPFAEPSRWRDDWDEE